MVVTCFDELESQKDVVFLRGDLIAGLNEDEGKTLMKRMLDTYLIESQFELVRRFNHEPNRFDYERYIKDELERFTVLNKYYIENKAEKLDMTRPKRKKHMTDAEMDIFKGGVIR